MEKNSQANYWWDNRHNLLNEYEKRYHMYINALNSIIDRLDELISFGNVNALVKGRVKRFEAFHRKLLLKSPGLDMDNPFEFITDLIGLRIVVPFVEDLQRIESIIKNNFEVIEIDYKSSDFTIREFGYDSTHVLVVIPKDILGETGIGEKMVGEIQIRTILQDAWAEVEHELVYKTKIDKVDDTIRRKLIALNATLSLADTIFQEIRDYQRKRYQDLQERHKKLIDKVSTIPEKMSKGDRIVGAGIPEKRDDDKGAMPDLNSGLNNLIIEALNAHLENKLERAVKLYTQILKVSPTHYFYNHRGLVYFTLSDYDRAINDFTQAVELNPDDMRVYTNRGLAYRMIRQFDKALADFNKSLEQNPLWPDTFYGRALTYYDLGDIKAALDNCDKAINLKPDFKQVVRFKQFILNQQ